MGYQFATGPDHDSAEGQGAKDTPKQNSMLPGARHFEIAKHQRNDEHVVHRERELNEVPGEKRGGIFRRPSRDQVWSESKTESQSCNDPDCGPDQRFTKGRFPAFPMEQAKIQRQRGHYENAEPEPVTEGNRCRRHSKLP